MSFKPEKFSCLTRADLDDGMPFLSQSQIIQDLYLPQNDEN
jgi:hypothetical protein